MESSLTVFVFPILECGGNAFAEESIGPSVSNFPNDGIRAFMQKVLQPLLFIGDAAECREFLARG